MSLSADPNRPYCRYCEEMTYHEYDPFFHAWVCQTCYGGIIRADKKDPFSKIRAEVNALAVQVAKEGYSLAARAKMKEVSERLKVLAERP